MPHGMVETPYGAVFSFSFSSCLGVVQGMPSFSSQNAAAVPLRRHGDEVESLPGGFYVAHGRCDDTMNLGGIKVCCSCCT